ncbi:MAG: 23S rRNA (uracil(1939)-C(5))-methyltransferase RlmD, partial [Erysipelotrichaceae bacterium]|nr:23S rRNA (uracil(1939)-C(5))-methyltransferase RlmD [Erysipelotrichaceae bacterium]
MKCPCEKQCGGCQTLDCQPALIRKKKKDLVQSLLDKNHLRARVSRVHMASRDTHYRNKVIVGFAKKKGKVTAGLYAQGSHRIVPNENCL